MHKIIFRLLPVCLLSTLLAACESMMAYHSKPFDELAPGSVLVLTQELVIPSGLAAVYLQDGVVVPENNVRVRQPHCKFEVNTISEITQTVKPDEFSISRFFIDRDYVLTGIRHYASVGGGDGDGGPIAEIYTVQMFLSSSQQPDVLRISCLHWEDPHDGQYLTFNQVQQAVGSIIQFKPR